MEHVTYDNMSNFTNDDICMRAAKFAANKLGVYTGEILSNSDLMKAAAKLFWDAYLEGEVEL
jgi:hypothetical protein